MKFPGLTKISFRSRIILITVGVVLAVMSLFYTYKLADVLRQKEQHDVELWVAAMERVSREAFGNYLVDPLISVRSTDGQIDDLVSEINKRISKGERTLVTTLTKKMAEDLTDYIEQTGIKVRYMHHDIDTMERMEIIRDLRTGEFDVLVGINLLREGLDIPEVSLVCILDADKEGFLRSETSLIQTIGRASRNSEGEVIMYADSVTPSMERAINETNRRREIQTRYNDENGIVPKTIKKDIRDVIEISSKPTDEKSGKKLSLKEREELIARLTREMKNAAKLLEFEHAAYLRDRIEQLRKGK